MNKGAWNRVLWTSFGLDIVLSLAVTACGSSDKNRKAGALDGGAGAEEAGGQSNGGASGQSSGGAGGRSNGGASGQSSGGASGSAGGTGLADSGAAGSGTNVDGSVSNPLTCGQPTTIVTVNRVSEVVTTTLPSGKYAVSWFETDAAHVAYHNARVFDGTKLLDEQQLDQDPNQLPPLLGSDGQGRVYAAWSLATNFARAVSDPATGVFGASNTVISSIQPVGIAGFAAGGAVLLYGTGTPANPTVEMSNPGLGTWSSPAVLGTGNDRQFGVATNTGGKAAVTWFGAAATYPLYVSTFDGANWTKPSAPMPLMAPGTPGAAVGPQLTEMYSNGDVLVVYEAETSSSGELRAIRFHPAEEAADAGVSAFDAPLPIDTVETSQVRVFMDAADRITAVYAKSGEVWAARNLGAGWGQPVDLAPGSVFGAAMDASGNVAVATLAVPSVVRRVAAAGTSWSAAVEDGFTFPQAGRALVDIAFDGAGDPVVFAVQDISTRATLQYSICK